MHRMISVQINFSVTIRLTQFDRIIISTTSVCNFLVSKIHLYFTNVTTCLRITLTTFFLELYQLTTLEKSGIFELSFLITTFKIATITTELHFVFVFGHCRLVTAVLREWLYTTTLLEFLFELIFAEFFCSKLHEEL